MTLPTRPTRSRSTSERLAAYFGRNAEPPTSTSRPPLYISVPEVGIREGRGARRLSKYHRSPSAHLTPSSAFPSSSSETEIIQPKLRRKLSIECAIFAPASFVYDGPSSRPPSRPSSREESRPASRAGDVSAVAASGPPSAYPGNEKRARRRSWLGGLSRRNSQAAEDVPAPPAWIAGHADKTAYDVAALLSGGRVEELWDDSGDAYIYLFPKSSGKSPSFKVQSKVFAASTWLTQLAHGASHYHHRMISGRRRPIEATVNTATITPPLTPKSRSFMNDNVSSGSSRGTRTSEDFPDMPNRQLSLYLPIDLSWDDAVASPTAFDTSTTEKDLDVLISARNLFAFLIGQSLVSTQKCPTVFDIFLQIAESLRSYDFTNFDASSFGEVASTSFDEYVEELGLGDVRSSCEKTIEAVVLGERMKSVLLYDEAFIHAAGKYSDIQHLGRKQGAAWKFEAISAVTRSRLERASIDLYHREKSINTRLLDFEFPSIFAGIINSRSVDERKVLQFGAWKDAFLATRKHVLAYYRHTYGAWPPKANGKKNDLETSGLNRSVIQAVYRDFADLYDLWVDRTSLTTRSSERSETEAEEPDPEEPIARILRRVFDEYDRSSPPVQPAVPYDIPLLPSPALGNRYTAKSRTKKLRDDEIAPLLDASTNADTLPKTSTSTFLASIRHFERRAVRRGCATPAHLVNLRVGAWIFCYAVLQALPMLAVDAPGVRHTSRVEYFLCEPPRSGAPWLSVGAGAGGARGRQSWYGIAGGAGGVVSLPSDLVEHGVEGVYRRSHCWVQAARWSDTLPDRAAHAAAIAAATDRAPPPQPPPPPLGARSGGGRGVRPAPGARDDLDALPAHVFTGDPLQSSPTTRSVARESVLSLGLEALPLPSGMVMSAVGGGGGGGGGGGTGSRASSRPGTGSRAASVRAEETARNTGRTFDDIFSEMGR